MKHHEDYFSAHDDLRLYEQCWLPDEPAAAIVVIAHGLSEHSGRYATLAEELCWRGYAVYAMDHRGHGRSDGARVYVRRFDDYLADVEVFLDRVKQREPGKPVFLFGHSMGASIAALLAIVRPPQVRGIVLSGLPVAIGSGVFPVLRRVAAFFSLIVPRLRFVRLGARYLSRDPQVVAAFEADPLVFHGRLPVRTGAEILNAAQRILAGAQSARLAMLLLHGTGDIVADAQGARQFHQRAASPDKTLRLYEDFYHEVLSDPGREWVLDDLIEWLNARRSTSP